MITEADFLAHARNNGIWLGGEGGQVRYIRDLIEKGIIPPRIAIREPGTRGVQWRFPAFALECLNILKEYGTFPKTEIAQITRPLIAQWKREWEARRHQAGEEGSINLLGEAGALYLALNEDEDIPRLRTACEKEGLPAKAFDELLYKVTRNQSLTEFEMNSFIFILRMAARLCADIRTRSIVFDTAHLLERRILLSKSQE